MLVRDLMQTDLKTIRGEASIADAVETLGTNHFSGLPVIDERGTLVGVLSASDVLQGLAECVGVEDRERFFGETLVREVMTPRPKVISPEATTKEAAQQLLYLEIHRLFVEDHGKLTGVITTTDLVRALALAAK